MYIITFVFNWFASTNTNEEDAVVQTSNDLTNLEPFALEHEQNNQMLLEAMPNCDSDNITAASNGTVDGYNEQSQDEDVFTDSPKLNRKMGVTTAIIEGTFMYWCVMLQ